MFCVSLQLKYITIIIEISAAEVLLLKSTISKSILINSFQQLLKDILVCSDYSGSVFVKLTCLLIELGKASVITVQSLYSARPIIIPLEVTFIVQVNCQAEIPCGQHVKGCPPASFSWSKMSQSGQIESQFIVDQANGSLLLSSPTRGDSGTYQCTARNSIGMDSALVMVLVLGM